MSLTVAQIDTAIEEVLNHQRHNIDGQEFEYADLDALRKLREIVQSETNGSSAGSMFKPSRFVNPA